MERRGFLRLAGAGACAVAGCSGASDSPTDSTSDGRSPGSGTDGGGRSTTSAADVGRIHVSVEAGERDNSGSRESPLPTIQAALGRAEPGDTVQVHPGHYYETVSTARDGEPGRPITITGPPEAVLHGSRGLDWSVGLRVRHSHVHLTGLTLDGLLDPERPEDPTSYANANYITPYGRDRYIEDLVVRPHAVGNVRQAAVKFNLANDVDVGEFEVIGPAGIQHLKGEKPGHNGEIVYVGTPYANLNKDYLDIDGIDESHGYRIHHIDNSAGHPHAELVDVKEGCYDVTVEYCTSVGAGQYVLPDHEPTSEAAMGVRGRDVTLRWCVLEASHGHGVEVGVWDLANPEEASPSPSTLPDVATEAGRNNAIYGNRIVGYGGLALRYPMDDDGIAEGYGPDEQRTVCGNEVDGPTQGAPGKSCTAGVPSGGAIGHLGGDSPWGE